MAVPLSPSTTEADPSRGRRLACDRAASARARLPTAGRDRGYSSSLSPRRPHARRGTARADWRGGRMTTETISPNRRQRPTVKRTVFATPRAAEFLELRALQAQTGQPAEAFGHVVVKELLDNALDGAETAGRAPIIDIGTRTDDEVTFVTVSDNGAGITARRRRRSVRLQHAGERQGPLPWPCPRRAGQRPENGARYPVCARRRRAGDHRGHRHPPRVTGDSRPGRRCRRHPRDDQQCPRGGHIGDRATTRRPRYQRPTVGVRSGTCKPARHHHRD